MPTRSASLSGRKGGARPPVLSRRSLNRATLRRQGLLERVERTPADLVHHLVGLQSQLPDPPYFSLWTRLAHFTQDELTGLIHDRVIVRTGVMRATLHLVTAEDFLWLRPLLQPVRERAQRGHFGKQTAGMDLEELKAVGRELLGARPHTNPELRKALSVRWPERDPSALMYSVHYLLPLVQVPPGGTWRSHGSVPCTTDEAWLGRSVTDEGTLQELVLRYLASYGPASVKDIQAWSGLTRLAQVVDGMRSRLCVFSDEQGRELFDLPDAPRPGPDAEAPVRFLPEYDNLLVAYDDRSRVISDDYRRMTHTRNGIVAPTILVDGVVRGQWRLERHKDRATLTIQGFETLRPADREALESEGLRMLAFAAPEYDHLVEFG